MKRCVRANHQYLFRIANKIVVLNNGTIEEIGNHTELMKAHGEYYKLFSTQAKRYQSPVGDERPPFDRMNPRHEMVD